MMMNILMHIADLAVRVHRHRPCMKTVMRTAIAIDFFSLVQSYSCPTFHPQLSTINQDDKFCTINNFEGDYQRFLLLFCVARIICTDAFNIVSPLFPVVSSTFCFTSAEARWLIRDGGGGGGGGGPKSEECRLDRGYRPKKTGETVDRRQNNGSVKAVSPRHCAATSALRIFAVSTAVLGRVTRTMSVALLLRNISKQKKSNFRSPAPPPCS